MCGSVTTKGEQMEEQITRMMELAEMNGALAERNRILAILVKYREAGWLDNALALLLTDDICVED
jgi:hypothetical protein